MMRSLVACHSTTLNSQAVFFGHNLSSHFFNAGGKVGNGHVPRERAQPQAPPLPPPLAPDEPLHVHVHNGHSGFSSDKVDGAREVEK